MEERRLIKGQTAQLSPDNIRNDNFLQRTVLSWVYGVVSRGRKGALTQEELRMPAAQACEAASQRFLGNWDKELSTSPAAPSLRRALWHSFGGEFALAGLFKLMWSAFVLMGASFFVNYLIEFVRGYSPDIDVNSLPDKGVGWVLSAAFFLDAILSGLALQRMGDTAVRCGMKVGADGTLGGGRW